ncbi:GNAT family N-acetyltransferase [Bacillus manliponensis]|uniref:GNAT family N-acetyltransferase n=1 Tax=Bacillus manliponensis TaxID=574376 RepID=UPI0035151B89
MISLYKGTLKQNEQAYNIKELSLEHVENILSLQSVVIEALENEDTLQPLTLEEYEYILTGHGLMIGAFVGEELIAFRALLSPPTNDEEHLGLDIGLQQNELHRVIYQEISNVHPAFRGNGLQKILANVIMKQLQQEQSKYDYVCCTVAPFNIPSLKDKFAQGMEITALKEKYNGRLRYVFMKDLRNGEQKDWKETIFLSMNDIARQQDLLSEGFRGYKIENCDGEYFVYFGK